MKSAFLISGLALTLLLPAGAIAAINKCTEANGRVVFSDQPCAGNQTGSVVKPTDAPKQLGPDAPLKSTSTDAAARIRAALSPECASLADKLDRLAITGGAGAAMDAGSKTTVERFQASCGESLGKATALESARDSAERKRISAANDCQTKSRVVQERKARPGGVSDADKPAVAAIEAGIARDCR